MGMVRTALPHLWIILVTAFFTLCCWHIVSGKSVRSRSELQAECQALLLTYMNTGNVIQQCTVRLDPLTSKQSLYWKVADCMDWTSAQLACEIGHGDLASFPTVDDKMYMIRFVSPYTSVHNSQAQHCMVPGSDVRNYGVWVGLSRPSSDIVEWTWKDGSKEQDAGIPWDLKLGNYNGNQYINSGGNCGYMGWGTGCCGRPEWAGDWGFVRAPCITTKAHAVCVKHLN